MNALRLNRLDNSLFKFSDVNSAANDIVRVCSADNSTSRVLNRAKIIAGCRLATVEYFGKQANANPTNIEKYNSKLGDNYTNFQKGT